MGYMRHHAIVVTAHGYPIADQALDAARSEAISLGCIVSGIYESPCNGIRSFFVAPDGSKDSWEESERGDTSRAALIEFMKSTRYEDGSSPLRWVEVQYGDDEWETVVTNDSDQDRREATGSDDEAQL